MSIRFTVLSNDPVTKYLPSPENVTLHTAPVKLINIFLKILDNLEIY